MGPQSLDHGTATPAGPPRHGQPGWASPHRLEERSFWRILRPVASAAAHLSGPVPRRRTQSYSGGDQGSTEAQPR